ncbi:MAG: hypothetical protein NUV51_09470 [Sulfuricaulis sp.]|nr:hypothetical protein [Sulfuricaulis sp.]
MCGVIGYQPCNPAVEAFAAFARLFDESRVRGTHAYGLATSARVVKSFDWREVTAQFDPAQPTIAHTRYCQSGDWHEMANNQPLVVGPMALAMNGVIHMGTKSEFEAAFGITCKADNDSEIFLQRLLAGQDAAEFIASITGSFAAVWLQDGKLYAGRNARRPLWECKVFGARWFASTRDIFLRAGFPEPTELAVGVV